MTIRRRNARTRVAALALLLALIAGSGCKDSTTLTGPSIERLDPTTTPTPTRTPTPAPAVDVSGPWNGFFDTSDDADCHSHVIASAELSQTGPNVSGTLSVDPNSCGMGGTVTATVVNGVLRGQVVKQGWSGGKMFGSVTSSEISVTIDNLDRPISENLGERIPGGILTLRR